MSKNLFIFEGNMNPMDLSKTRTQFLSRLSSKKVRDEAGIFLVEGFKSIREMLGKFEIEEIISTKNWFENNPHNFEEYKIRIATESQMKKISSMSSLPDSIAVFQIPDNSTDLYDLKLDELYLCLDGIQDPGNMGTLIRTADWFGIKKVFISNDSADVYSSKTIQASMGSLSHVKVIRHNLVNLIGKYPDMPVIGTLLEGRNIFESELPANGFLIMGNEGNGISEDLRKKVTIPVLIPPFDPSCHPDSLNVGVACGIALAAIRR